jgi:hypothetical protein
MTLEREIMPTPSPPPTRNNAHFNMCRGACSSIVLTIWNIRHITSCILPLPGRWLQRRIVSGGWVPLCIVWRAVLYASAATLIYVAILRTFKYESNSRPSVWFCWHLKNSLYVASVTFRLMWHLSREQWISLKRWEVWEYCSEFPKVIMWLFVA